MAKKTKLVSREVEELDTIKCDRCGVEVDAKVDWEKAQAFLSLEEKYGYGSEHFGDLSAMVLDLCEGCTYERLGEWCTIVEYDLNSGVVFKPMEDPEDLDIYQR